MGPFYVSGVFHGPLLVVRYWDITSFPLSSMPLVLLQNTLLSGSFELVTCGIWHPSVAFDVMVPIFSEDL